MPSAPSPPAGRPRRALAAALLVPLAAALAGCQSVPMEPAPDAQNVDCAYVSLALPKTVDGLEQRLTNAQATGAWGTPAHVLLRCGVTPPGPTDAQCVTVNGVDWIKDESEAPTYRFTTYGREPAVEVLIDASPESGVSGTAALVDLGPAVSRIPATSGCIGAEDVFAVPTPAGQPGGATDPAATEPASTETAASEAPAETTAP